MNAHQTHLLAFAHEEVDGLLGGLGHGAHGDDYVFGVFGAVVCEEVVFTAGDFGNLLHVVLDDCGDGVVGGVACLAVLEENVAVLGHAAHHGSLGGEAALTEAGQSLAVEQRFELVLLDHLYLLDLMAGAEAVEEVDEGDEAFDCGQMSHA